MLTLDICDCSSCCREKERQEALKKQEMTTEEMLEQKRKVDFIYNNWEDSDEA